jgi:hypothetical protein
MSPNDRDAIDRLDDDLDRLTGSPPVRSNDADADAALVETHRRVRDLDSTPGPDPYFVRRLMEDLMHATAFPAADGSRISMNGAFHTQRTSLTAPAPIPISRRSRLLPLVAAVLLVFAVAGAVFRDGLPGRPDRNPAIPAAMAPQGTPDATTMTEHTLLDLQLPAELLPHGDQIVGELYHMTVPDGRATWAGHEGDCCPGTRVEHVLTGGYSMSGDGELLVARAGANEWEMIPAGTSAEIREGDTVAYSNAIRVTFDNPGTGPVEVLYFIIVESEIGLTSDPIPGGWKITKSVGRDRLSLADGPARLRLRLIELPPGVNLKPAGLQWGITRTVDDEGTPVPPFLFVRRDGSMTNDGDAPLPVYVLNVESPGTAAETPVGSPTT